MIMMNNLSFDKEEMTKWEGRNFFEVLIPSSLGEWLTLIAFTVFALIIVRDRSKFTIGEIAFMFTFIVVLFGGAYILIGGQAYNDSLINDAKNNLQEVAFESTGFDYDDIKSSTTNDIFKI